MKTTRTGNLESADHIRSTITSLVLSENVSYVAIGPTVPMVPNVAVVEQPAEADDHTEIGPELRTLPERS